VIEMRVIARAPAALDTGRGLTPALELALQRVRLRARLRAMWLRTFRTEAAGYDAIGFDEVDRVLTDADHPAAERVFQAQDPHARAIVARLSDAEAAQAANTSSRLAELGRIFGLSTEELNAVEICVALALDPGFGRAFAWLQNDPRRGHVTAALVDRLFDHGQTNWFSPASALRTWSLLTEREVAAGEPPALECDPLVLAYLLGSDEPDPLLRGLGGMLEVYPPLSSWPVQPAVEAARAAIGQPSPMPVRLRFTGPDGSGRRSCAAAVARVLGLPLLGLRADLVPDDTWEGVFAAAQRWAWLHSVAICWAGPTALARPWPEQVPWFPLQCATGTHETLATPPPCRAIDRVFVLTAPTLADLRAVWVAHAPAADGWDEGEVNTLLGQAGSVGIAAAAGARRPLDCRQARRALREVAREGLRDLAEPMPCSFTWDDLVVGPAVRAALEDYVFEARDRAAVWGRDEARRLFPMGRGLLALLSGPPGTGKTMAAQVVAAALGRDLYRVNLANLVSKYVGETARNIDRVLKTYGDQLILWDEADVVFSPRLRSDGAQEHFVNAEIGHLLQAIESYAGLSLLTTNRRTEMDPAFARRIRYLIDFTSPDVGQRERILSNAVGAMVDSGQVSGLQPGIAELARSVECTGAQLKNCVLTAVFRARQQGVALAPTHLVYGLERELAKDGRVLHPGVRQRLAAR
jgi:hypothetical protein